MAWEKSPPRLVSPASAPNGAALDARSPVSSLSGDPRRAPSRCSVYAVKGGEPWISHQDMDHLKQLQLVGGHDLTKNGDQRDRSFKHLPKGCKLGKLVGEGAANAVFEFQLPDGSHLYHQNTRTLPPPPALFMPRQVCLMLLAPCLESADQVLTGTQASFYGLPRNQ